MINYSIIQKSIDFYDKVGFTRIETPWYVSKNVAAITKPPNLRDDEFILNHNDKRLVASGEQGFLYLYLKGFLPKGKFQTVTPCFRFESHDETHTKTFIKNELISTSDISKTTLESIISNCYNYFKSIGFDNKLNVVKTDIGFDINYLDTELGSYGIRETSFLKYIYATGVSEPRASYLLNKYELPYKEN
jgi:seryl-tRNA synthetase